MRDNELIKNLIKEEQEKIRAELLRRKQEKDKKEIK